MRASRVNPSGSHEFSPFGCSFASRSEASIAPPPFRRAVGLLLLGLLAWGAALVSPPQEARAQTVLEINDNRAEISFPESVTFFLDAAHLASIERVTLRYGTNGRTCQVRAARQLLDFEPAPSVSLQWTWDLERSGVLPPGAEVWWQWELEASDGVTHQTPVEQIPIRDDRQAWQSRSQTGITVQWYLGGADFGGRLLDIAVQSLDRLERELGVRPDGDIRILVYPDAAAVQSALLHAAEWTGGVAFPSYNSILIGVAPGEEDWARAVIPHELAHLVVGTRAFNCQGIQLPTWLSEGLAVFAEGPIGSDDHSLVLRNLGRGTLPRLLSLAAGFSAYGDRAALAYAQSGLVVAYLVDQGGPDGIDALLSSMQAGSDVDAALAEVYGVDTDGLDNDFREELGFPVTPAPSPGDSPPGPQPSPTGIPTLALMVVTPDPTSTPAETPVLTPTPVPGASTRRAATPMQETPGVEDAEPGSAAEQAAWPWVVGAGAGFVLFLTVLVVLRRGRS